MKKFIIAGLTLVPITAFAQGTVEDALDTVSTMLTDKVIPLLIVLATVVFLWGIVRYVTAGGDEEKIKQGRNLMIFGIIALAIMISVWGIARLLTTTFGVGGEAVPTGVGTF
jgi:hypothetical protein